MGPAAPFQPPPKPPFCSVERLDNGYLVSYLDVQPAEPIDRPRHPEPPKDEAEKMKRAIEEQVVKELDRDTVVHRRVFCKSPKEVCDYADRACAAYEEVRKVSFGNVIYCG